MNHIRREERRRTPCGLLGRTSDPLLSDRVLAKRFTDEWLAYNRVDSGVYGSQRKFASKRVSLTGLEKQSSQTIRLRLRPK